LTSKRINPSIAVKLPRWVTRGLLLAADLLTLSVVWGVALLCRWSLQHFSVLEEPFVLMRYIELWPGIGLFLAAYAAAGLYPGVGLNPPEEIRLITNATSLVFLVVVALTFLSQVGVLYSRWVFAFAWMLSLVCVPIIRSLVRVTFAYKKWWGYPVLILGAGKTGRKVIKALQHRPGLGLRPVAVLDDNPEKHGTLRGIPVVGGTELAPMLAQEHGISYAILAMPGVSRERLLELGDRLDRVIPHVLLIPDLFGFSTLWVEAKEYGGILGLEIRHRLLDPWAQSLKRLSDLLLGTFLLLLALPFMILVGILIRLDSLGPVLFSQDQLGRDDSRIRPLKFRTMFVNAEERLEELLARDPEMRREYQTFHKLQDDPRVTRVGRILRYLSLDELPQLWNVVKGEMSLVGPRPYLPRERPEMNGLESTILRVVPGITGLWQVSGRNELSFRMRCELDVYYVRNWSIWFDCYILAKTAWAVAFSRSTA